MARTITGYCTTTEYWLGWFVDREQVKGDAQLTTFDWSGYKDSFNRSKCFVTLSEDFSHLKSILFVLDQAAIAKQ